MTRPPGYRPSRAELETLKALAARKGKPTDADAPPLSTFPGPKAKPLPGQLVLGDEVGDAVRPKP